MASKTENKSTTRGTPRPWSELLRRHWPRVHTIEVDWRTNNRGTWSSLEGSAVIIPEVDDDKREGPEAAAAMAGTMYEKAWQHLDERDEDTRRLCYQLSAWEYDEKTGALVLLENTSIGGVLRRDGTVESVDDDDASDAERTRAREDYNWGLYKKSTDINFKLFDKVVGILGKVESIVGAAWDAQSEAAAHAAESQRDKYEFEIDKAQLKAFEGAFRDFTQNMGGAATIYASAKYAEHTRPGGPRPAKHDDARVEAARVLLDHLNGPALAKLSLVLDAELIQDVMVVLAVALEDSPNVDELRAGWVAVAPQLIAKQPEIAGVLEKKVAEGLQAALVAFHEIVTTDPEKATG